MQNENLIHIETFCENHGIDVAFITTVQNFGLIEIIVIEGNQYLAPEILADVEKMIRMHYALNINIEGINTHNSLYSAYCSQYFPYFS